MILSTYGSRALHPEREGDLLAMWLAAKDTLLQGIGHAFGLHRTHERVQERCLECVAILVTCWPELGMRLLHMRMFNDVCFAMRAFRDRATVQRAGLRALCAVASSDPLCRTRVHADLHLVELELITQKFSSEELEGEAARLLGIIHPWPAFD